MSLALSPGDAQAVPFSIQSGLAVAGASVTYAEGIAGSWNLPANKVFVLDATVAATKDKLGSFPFFVRKGAITLQLVEPQP